ncbi:MAG: hypothetical protein RI993_22 [Pseudomonadota bacterium]|jgi:hypothetical protein
MFGLFCIGDLKTNDAIRTFVGIYTLSCSSKNPISLHCYSQTFRVSFMSLTIVFRVG